MTNDKDLKVVPIGGKHRSFNSLAGEAMEDGSARRGIVFWFDDDDAMHVGEFGLHYKDAGMVLMHMMQIASEWNR